MRLLHTADWHLGRLFHGVYLTEDQAHILDRFVELVRETKPDAILIAGDIYDRAVPPPEAVALLDDVLDRLVRGLGVRVILIAGNHDGPTRLAFSSRLLAEQGLHVFGQCQADTAAVVLDDTDGPVPLYALPYAEPPVVRGVTGDETIHDHDAAMRALLGRINPSPRAVLVAHALVLGGEGTESERPLSIGGAGTVEASCFDGFAYVALGHLHRPQHMGGDRIHYAGSLLKYSFSEADTAKSVNLVELGADTCRVERISLPPRRDLRIVDGVLADILREPHGNREDYLQVVLRDTGAIFDALGKLRDIYPNVLEIKRPNFELAGQVQGAGVDHRTRDTAALFGDFFAQVTGEAPTGEQADAFADAANRVQRVAREAVPA